MNIAIKPLEWKSRGRKNGDTYANSVVGQYSVGDIWGEIKSLLRTIVDGQDADQVMGVHGSFEEAKAAAQADYEARIRSALSAQVQDVDRRSRRIERENACSCSPVSEKCVTATGIVTCNHCGNVNGRVIAAAPAAKLEGKP